MPIEELQGGRYRYIRLLGMGGMGEVYLMQDTRVSRQVGVKVIRSEGAAYSAHDTASDAARLFQREAKAIAALEHPNILPLYDFGEETHDDATLSYMVMPFCPDGSLTSWLKQRGTANLLPPQDVADLLEQAAEALQYAHDQHIIHLDVKPSNFLLRSNKKNPQHPTLLLADFGIARSSTTVSSASRVIRGTPTAMAPEQWSSTPVPASDQYALAVMVYELLTGRPPFSGSMEQLMYQHFKTQPPAPNTFNPHLSTALGLVLARALAKEPAERFPSIADFASAFAEVAHQSAQPPEQANADDYVTLTISRTETEVGLNRLQTIPSDDQIHLTIPKDVPDGQVFPLANPLSSESDKAAFVAIAVQPSNETPVVKAIARDEQAPDTPHHNIQQPVQFGSEHNLPTLAITETKEPVTGKPLPNPAQAPSRRFGLLAFVALLVVLLLVGGSIFAYRSYRPTSSGQHVTATTIVKLSPTPTATPLPGLFIAGTYNGSMADQTTGRTTSVTVLIVQNNGSGVIQGSLTFKSSNQGVFTLHGTVDLQGNFAFTVQQPAGQTPLYMHGAVQRGVYLHGNYCSSSTSSCSADTGYFTVGPKF
ncbi:MAG: serine/threonine-protein kinase [Ktedonobacteraceae bacterium]